jgi:hypothetical protein
MRNETSIIAYKEGFTIECTRVGTNDTTCTAWFKKTDGISLNKPDTLPTPSPAKMRVWVHNSTGLNARLFTRKAGEVRISNLSTVVETMYANAEDACCQAPITTSIANTPAITGTTTATTTLSDSSILTTPVTSTPTNIGSLSDSGALSNTSSINNTPTTTRTLTASNLHIVSDTILGIPCDNYSK